MSKKMSAKTFYEIIKNGKTDSIKKNLTPQEGQAKDEMSSTFWLNKTTEEDPWLPNLSKSQRIIGFFLTLILGIFCFLMAGLLTPVLILKLRKFVLLYTMGSFFTIGSFALLWGPVNHFKHITSVSRLPFTIAYFGSMMATLYSALALRSTIVTLLFASVQILTLLWYVFSYIPGGVSGMKFLSKLLTSSCTKTVSKTLSI